MKLNYLDKCKDYNILKQHLNDKGLEYIDALITCYEELTDKNYYFNNYSLYEIDWYEGLITTNDLIDIYKNAEYLKFLK